MTRINWPEDLTPEDYCPLNPHRNTKMKDVPKGFLKWAHDTFIDKDKITSQSFWLVSRYYKRHSEGAEAKSSIGR